MAGPQFLLKDFTANTRTGTVVRWSTLGMVEADIAFTEQDTAEGSPVPTSVYLSAAMTSAPPADGYYAIMVYNDVRATGDFIRTYWAYLKTTDASGELELFDTQLEAWMSRNVASFSTIDAAGIRSAVGLSTANLDTQIGDIPTVAEFEARTLPTADYFDPATDTVAHVTLVDTTTTNTDMRGTDGANTTAPDNASIAAILADTNELQTNQGNWLTATGFSTLDAAGVRAAVGLASANLDTQLADIPTTAEFEARTLLAANYFDPATDTVANVTLVATCTTNTDMRGTDGAYTGTPPTAAAIASQVAAIDIDGKQLDAALEYIAAICAGKVSGAGTGTEVFKGLDGTTTRVTVTADSSGNRTDVTYG